MNLIEQIDEKRKDIKTDGYAMSISEWISIYERNEIDIHPEFQRIFRWSDEQKTSLIESILLGIPLPAVFVSQRKDGIWDVVDGLQRLSTILQFVGVLLDENKKKILPLTLKKTKYLPALEGVKWNNEENSKLSLPPEAQLLIRRAKISVSIILKESDETAKYDLFQRLNTGGSELSPQEVRNCLLLMLNRKMFIWLKDLASYPSFREVIALSDRPMDEAYDIELTLRFIVFLNMKSSDLNKIGDVGIFLTDRMTELAKNKKFPYQKNSQIFKQTFDLLESVAGELSFKRYNKIKNRHEGGFLLSQYEVVALGVGFNIENNTLIESKKIPKTISSIWSNSEYTDWSSSGITATRRLPHLIPLGRQLFSNK